MASWHTSPGGLTGYDAGSASLEREAYLFASPGTVDVNGITRLQYNLPSLPDQILASVVINFTAADLATYPGGATAAMCIAPASAFAPGYIPTPGQIKGASTITYVGTVTSSVPIGGGDYRASFDIVGPRANQLSAGTKYWVMVTPAIISGPGTVNMWQGDADILGRALSMWANRPPAAPVITSPDAVVSSGAVVTLNFTVDDPDDVTGTDYFDRDLAGIQVQYAAKPTASNPSPTWQDMQGAGSDSVVRALWYIKGSGAGPTHPNSLSKDVWENLELDIKCSDDIIADHGNLPAGAWQVRVRAFDFGHPYPLTEQPAALSGSGFSIAAFPAANTSPWSAPMSIAISTQIPPPIPLSPVDDVAIAEGTDVTLRWRYRNTFLPPYAQAGRTVQIKKVSDTDWTTLVNGPSADAEFDITDALVLPDDLTPGSLRFWGWEDAGAGLDGWTKDDAGPGTDHLLRGVVGGLAHTGVGYITRRTRTGNPPAFWVDHDGPVFEGQTYAVDGWFHNSTASNIDLRIDWLDLFGTVLGSSAGSTEVGISAWAPIADSGVAPAGAVGLRIVVTPNTADGVLSRFDDFTLSGPVPVPYGLEATTEYLWRVQVTDADGEVSDYSEVARFWVVPTPASGVVIGAPTETLDDATLGCGTHRVYVYRRGGKVRVGEIKGLNYTDWNRVRDDISTSKQVTMNWDLDCGRLLALLQTWAYEIVVFRDNGHSVDRVWEGPITLLTYETDKVTIEAKDVMGYAYRRILRQAMNDMGDGDAVTSRAARVLQNAFAPDDPNVLAYLQVLASEGDATEYRNTPAYSRTAFEEVDDMAANAGLDYCAVGRAILLWGTKHRIGTLPEFRDEDLGSPPIVSEYGMSMANRYVVSDGNGVFGEANRLDESGNDENYGLVEMLSSSWASDSEEDSGTYTAAGLATVIESFEGYAERSIANRYPPPVVVRVPDSTTLNPGTVISIQHLVPGVVVPLRSVGTLRQVVADQKLDQVKVVETGGKETISITLSPFNYDDASAEVEGG